MHGNYNEVPGWETSDDTLLITNRSRKPLLQGDTLIADVIDFFASCKYNTDIVDLLMQNTTDALDSGPTHLPKQCGPCAGF